MQLKIRAGERIIERKRGNKRERGGGGFVYLGTLYHPYIHDDTMCTKNIIFGGENRSERTAIKRYLGLLDFCNQSSRCPIATVIWWYYVSYVPVLLQ